jgi:alanine racemase
MNRLGLAADEVEDVAGTNDLWSALKLSLVMSHLACADDPQHPKSEAQREAFDRLRARLPKTAGSLANSAGILLGARYLYDLVRPGIALYGGKPCRSGGNPFAPVVRLEGRILQVRNVGAGETVGYGATRTVRDAARIATVAVGYADGFFRALSASDGIEGLVVSVEGHAAPVLGRVSMDLITVDVTGVPERVSRRGAWVELIGPNVTAQEVAARAGTIDYEVLTSLGRRAARRYVGGS